HTARCAGPPCVLRKQQKKNRSNRATLRVAPAPAARCANANRSNCPNTHELRAAPVQAARCADGRKPNRPS
ncbi:hypothetical protein A2U01_0104430, partial [Trifolium medium]|nr:hypothetical protein [Trifolium medium]